MSMFYVRTDGHLSAFAARRGCKDMRMHAAAGSAQRLPRLVVPDACKAIRAANATQLA